MRLALVDTHAHLDMAAFRSDRAEVMIRAREAGVSHIITVATDLESSQSAIKLAESHPGIFASVGFHPHEAAGVTEPDMEKVTRLAEHPRVVAIGETGLDFHRNYAPREAQLRALRWQLELATATKLPVIIHCRQAEKEILDILRGWTPRYRETTGRPPGVIHCFNGDRETADRYLEMGFFISFGAYIGYPASRHRHDTISSLPRDRLLLETDSPFLPPQEHRGQRNEPAYLATTASLLARIRELPVATVARETTENARRLFHLDQADFLSGIIR